MVVDFADFKHDLKLIADDFDHSLIYEKDTLKPKTLEALQEENFRLIEVEFRPTAENFSKHIFDILMSKGYNVKSITVYETPSNCATYTGE
jgi:6-pyruvoyltetrahydropterin/6-carboxytetrahydropterin synthase